MNFVFVVILKIINEKYNKVYGDLILIDFYEYYLCILILLEVVYLNRVRYMYIFFF